MDAFEGNHPRNRMIPNRSVVENNVELLPSCTACRQTMRVILHCSTCGQGFHHYCIKKVDGFNYCTACLPRPSMSVHVGTHEGCCVCRQVDEQVQNIVQCVECSREYHTHCLHSPILNQCEESLDPWTCPLCIEDTTQTSLQSLLTANHVTMPDLIHCTENALQYPLPSQDAGHRIQVLLHTLRQGS